jgi:hypothetical protein
LQISTEGNGKQKCFARDATLKIFSGREVTFEDGSKRIFGGEPSNAWECHTGDCRPSVHYQNNLL